MKTFKLTFVGHVPGIPKEEQSIFITISDSDIEKYLFEEMGGRELMQNILLGAINALLENIPKKG